VLKMSSRRFNARLDTSHYGPPLPCRDAGVVADSLMDIHNASSLSAGAACAPTGKNPEDWNLTWSVEAMQGVLLQLFVGRDRCY
jgi:hypothetical protein